ncbi:MAG: PilZ protein [Candidatus Sulfotelmatobacter sp.]|nr:PilZ protein [Candidatus Sulfotelmatobacter sp.]
MEAQNQHVTGPHTNIAEKRQQPRFKLTVKIRVNSRTCGSLSGHTVDISRSGISAMLKIEVPLGELVELEFTVPIGAVTVYAMVRQRSAFRYGMQFVESKPVMEIIEATCRQLAVEQALLGDL